MIKSILSLAIIGLLTSCTSKKEVMKSWVGESKQNLIISWGPPEQIIEDGEGGEILAYSRQVNAPVSYYANNSYQTTSITEFEYQIFWVNSEGKIYQHETHRVYDRSQFNLYDYRRN